MAEDFKSIHLPEQLTGDSREEMMQLFDGAISENCKKIVADAGELTYVNSYGIGMLVKYIRKLKGLGIKMDIENAKGSVKQLFGQMGVERLLKMPVPEPGDDEEDLPIDEDPALGPPTEEKLSLSYKMVDDVALFELTGVLLFPSGETKFKDQAMLAMDESKKFLLNLSGLTYVDSGAVGELMMINNLLRKSDGEMRVCSLNDIVEDLWVSLELKQAIPYFPDETSALEGWALPLPPND